MTQDVRKMAALAMLSLTEREAELLRRQIPEILALTDSLQDVPEIPSSAEGAVGLDQLREDTAQGPDTERRNIHLSHNEKEGFVRVARTVG